MKLGKATREAFGLALAQLGESHSDVVVIDGDVGNSTRTEIFGKKFPARFFNVGIAESNLVGVAAGLASSGKRAWVASFATFVMSNAFDQLRMSVAFPCLDVKVVGTHAGISIGEDGPSQMGIEDVGLACSLPNFTVVVPCDEPSMFKAVAALGEIRTPAYLRAGRPNTPIIYENGCNFELAKANVLRAGKDLTIIACGLMVPGRRARNGPHRRRRGASSARRPGQRRRHVRRTPVSRADALRRHQRHVRRIWQAGGVAGEIRLDGA
jgi:transketolase